MNTCDVCGAKLSFMGRFRYAEGHICKECYKKASQQYTQTITKKTLTEIRKLCQNHSGIKQEQDFEITGRIGNYMLLDEKNRKICILNNRIIKKQACSPDFYKMKDIESFEIRSEPRFTKEDLEKKIQQKEKTLIQSLKVCIKLRGEKKPVDITLISSGARIKSYAFQQSYRFAKRIEESLYMLQQ